MYKVLRSLNKIYENRHQPCFPAFSRREIQTAQSMFACDVAEIVKQMHGFAPDLADIAVRSFLVPFQPQLKPREESEGKHFAFKALLTPRGTWRKRATYFLSVEPGACHIAGGIVPPSHKIDKAVRNFIVGHTDEFKSIVEDPEFKKMFPDFGAEIREKYPRGMQRDRTFEHYLYIREFAVCKKLNNRFFSSETWRTEVAEMFRVMQPLVDFINRAIDETGEP